MFNVFYVEFLKIKKSKILWLIPVTIAVNVFLHILAATSTGNMFTYRGWAYYIGYGFQSINLIASIVFMLFAGFIFTREYHDRTISGMFTYPLSRLKVFTSKMLILIPVIVTITFLLFLFDLCIGRFVVNGNLTIEILIIYIKNYLVMVIVNFALIPAAITVGIISKNVTAVAVTSVICFSAEIGFLNTKFNVYFPWCIPCLLASKWGQYEQFWQINDTHAFITLGVIFLIPLIFNILYYKNLEVV
jgi:bacitracin transport system permease protein